LLIVGGLSCPCWAAGFGGLLIVGRFIYAAGYSSGGPKGRMIGALLVDVALLGLFYFSLCACYTIIKGDKLVKGEL
jgi:glutathione S-transferase